MKTTHFLAAYEAWQAAAQSLRTGNAFREAEFTNLLRS